MSKKHSEIGASIAHRWLYCTASVADSRKYPPTKASFVMDEGTVAHHLLETNMGKDTLDSQKGRRFDVVNGEVRAKANGKHLVDDQAIAAVRFAREYIWQIAKDEVRPKYPQFQTLVEDALTLHDIDPEMFGTGDVCLVQPFSEGWVFDYKHGEGKRVVAEGNPQLAFYGLALARKYGLSQVHVFIIQPRIPMGDKITRVTYTEEDLNQWEEMFKASVKEVRTSPVFRPEPNGYCKWCPAEADCPARTKAMCDGIDAQFDDNTQVAILPNPAKAKDFSKLLKGKAAVQAWLKAVERLEERLIEDKNIPAGFKIGTAKKGDRVWTNEEEVIGRVSMLFGDAALYEKKIRTPSQLEKAGHDIYESVADLVEQKPGKPKLVEDKEAVDGVAAMFEYTENN